MRRHSAFMTLCAAILCAVPMLAQGTPDFSGKWTAIPDPSGAAGGGRGGFGETATIKQDATSLTVTRSTQMGEFTSTYKLDGTESRNMLNIQGNAIEQLSKTKWDGGKLIINTSMNFGGSAVEVSSTVSLDASGNMVVVTTRPDFQGGGGPITTTTTYKKN